MSAEKRLSELGIILPPVRPAKYSYVKTRRTDTGLLYVAGHSPKKDGAYPHTGKLGVDVTLEQGQECARICLLNALASVKSDLGSLDRVTQAVKLVGFVASASDFYEQAKVIDPASEILVDIFGEAGRHARSSVGVAVLPGNIPVEIELILAFKMD